MASGSITVKLKAEGVQAFALALYALREIVQAEQETNDADTRDRGYGIGREIAEDALARIDEALAGSDVAE